MVGGAQEVDSLGTLRVVIIVFRCGAVSGIGVSSERALQAVRCGRLKRRHGHIGACPSS